MKLTLKRINFFSPDHGKISRLYRTAFPADERAPMWFMVLKSGRENVDFWGLYADGEWVGLAYVISERVTLLRTAKRGSGRVRSPSKWLSPFLTPFSVFLRKGDFAPCGERPKAPPLETATFEKVDETFSVCRNTKD